MKYWGAMTAANTANSDNAGEGLTLAKLEALMRSIPKLPPTPKYDVYPSDFVTEAYEINCPDDLAPPGCVGRKMIVAPRAQAWHWYTQLRGLGVDVRWQPRAGAASSEGEEVR